MSFWQKVENEMKYKGIPRKDLSISAKVGYSGIGTSIERQSIPAADTALRIAKVLNVSLDYLLSDEDIKVNINEEKKKLELFHKYSTHIQILEKLSLEKQKIIEDLAQDLLII